MVYNNTSDTSSNPNPNETLFKPDEIDQYDQLENSKGGTVPTSEDHKKTGVILNDPTLGYDNPW